MLTAISNAMNDHQFMNTAINTLGAFTMLLGLVVLTLCAVHPLRHKR